MRQKYICVRGIMILFLLLTVSAAAAHQRRSNDIPKIEGKIVVETNPTPTCVEKESDFVPLVPVGKIDAEFDDEHFLVRPSCLCTDNRGHVYVFDRKWGNIFVFDETFKFIKTFGQTGQGPGEFGRNASVHALRFSQDGFLYLSDGGNRKFIIFDTDGNHKKDIVLPPSARLDSEFQPLIDNTGNYYLLTGPACTIDVHNIHDKDKPKRYSLLGPGDCRKSVLLNVRDEDAWFWCATSTSDTFYDELPGGRLIVYLRNTSTIKIFKGETIQETFDVWPAGVLQRYRKWIAEKFSQKPGKQKILIIYMFMVFCMDKDTGAHFYLQAPGEGDRKNLLYKFDLKGNLLSIFYTPDGGFFREKRNNLFYFISSDSIRIYRAGKQPGSDKKN